MQLCVQYSACYHIYQEGDRGQLYHGGDSSILSCMTTVAMVLFILILLVIFTVLLLGELAILYGCHQ